MISWLCISISDSSQTNMEWSAVSDLQRGAGTSGCWRSLLTMYSTEESLWKSSWRFQTQKWHGIWEYLSPTYRRNPHHPSLTSPLTSQPASTVTQYSKEQNSFGVVVTLTKGIDRGQQKINVLLMFILISTNCSKYRSNYLFKTTDQTTTVPIMSLSPPTIQTTVCPRYKWLYNPNEQVESCSWKIGDSSWWVDFRLSIGNQVNTQFLALWQYTVFFDAIQGYYGSCL